MGGGDDDLFEGMVLFSPSDNDFSSPPDDDKTIAPPPPNGSFPPLPAIVIQRDPSCPLDEDLFSDLTLQSPENSDSGQHSLDDSPLPGPSLFSRQILRKKKRAVRIGYARDLHAIIPVEDAAPPINSEDQTLDPPQLDPVFDVHGAPRTPELPVLHKEEKTVENIYLEEDASSSSFRELERIRGCILQKLDDIRRTWALVSAERKDLARRRRRAAESVRSASDEYKKLDKEMEEACEAEDFERAERISERLAASEKNKEGLFCTLRDAEAAYDSIDTKIQDILEQRVVVEEESAALFEQFAKSATIRAEAVLQNAKDISSKKTEELESSIEMLETRRTEIDIVSHLMGEVRLQLDSRIEHLLENDRKEKVVLLGMKDNLARELEELLGIVKIKESEIAENESKIQEIDKRMSTVTAGIYGSQSSIDRKGNELKLCISRIESEKEALCRQEAEISKSLSLAEEKRAKLLELANASFDEARNCRDLVERRKRLASFILKIREEKLLLATTEMKILEEVQVLRQQVSAARSSLQEFSSLSSNIQQDIASIDQRLCFVEKRTPELEGEKKVAAAARNFREAGRIAAEAKMLNLETEELFKRQNKSISELEKLDQEMRNTVDKIQESEDVISSREKEAAMAGYKRLQLIAASTKAESSAALELGDEDESEILRQEAEDAESKAKDLQKTFGLELEIPTECFMSLIADFDDKDLAKISSTSIQPDRSAQQA